MRPLTGVPMELFDERNPDGTKTGVVKERGVAHREGALHATVHIWIVRPNDLSGYDVLPAEAEQDEGIQSGVLRHLLRRACERRM